MEILGLIVINLVVVGISTAVLALALLLVGEPIDKDTLLKCLGLVVVGTLVSFVPVIGGIVSLFVWIAGIMAVFEKTFLESLLISFVCWAIYFGSLFGIAWLSATLA